MKVAKKISANRPRHGSDDRDGAADVDALGLGYFARDRFRTALIDLNEMQVGESSQRQHQGQNQRCQHAAPRDEKAADH